MNICIYGSASNDIDRAYIEKTEEKSNSPEKSKIVKMTNFKILCAK